LINNIGGDEAAQPVLKFYLTWRADWLISLENNCQTVLGVTIG